MIHGRTGPEGVEGTLRLESGGVVFRPKYEVSPDLFVPFEAVRRARRLMASPVLELRLRLPDGPKTVGFYFVRPPNLDVQRDGGRLARTRAKRDAAVSLVSSNVGKKDEVKRWVRSIREAKKGR